MKEYVIKKVSGTPIDWSVIPKTNIEIYKWTDNDYRPKVNAALCYDKDAIYVKFWAYESEIRCIHKEHNSNVFEDSCVEFFLRPNSDPNYINIETNALGKQLVGFGQKRADRKRIIVSDETMHTVPSVLDASLYNEEMWTMEYQVSFAFLKEQYGDVNIVDDGLRANLFKCGDFTKYVHFGMWNEIESDEDDFHKPEWFGSMIFEK